MNIPKKIKAKYKEISDKHGTPMEKIKELFDAYVDAELKANKKRSTPLKDADIAKLADRRVSLALQSQIDTRAQPWEGFLIGMDTPRNAVGKQRRTQLEEYKRDPLAAIRDGMVAVIIENPGELGNEDMIDESYDITTDQMDAMGSVVATTKSGLLVISKIEGNPNLTEFIEKRGIDLPQGDYPLDTNEYPVWDKKKQNKNKRWGCPLPKENIINTMVGLEYIDKEWTPCQMALKFDEARITDYPIGKYVKTSLIKGQTQNKEGVTLYSVPKDTVFNVAKAPKGTADKEWMVTNAGQNFGDRYQDIVDLDECHTEHEKEFGYWIVFEADIENLIPPATGNSHIISLTDISRPDMRRVYSRGSVTGFVPEHILESCDFSVTDHVLIVGRTVRKEERDVAVGIWGIHSQEATAEVDIGAILGSGDDSKEEQHIEDIYAGYETGE